LLVKVAGPRRRLLVWDRVVGMGKIKVRVRPSLFCFCLVGGGDAGCARGRSLHRHR